MIEGTGECYSQSASHAISFIKDLLPHLMKMVWILIAYWAISVKNEDLTPLFLDPFVFAAPQPLETAATLTPFSEEVLILAL